MLERRKKEKKVNSFNAPNVYQFAENVSQRQYFGVTFLCICLEVRYQIHCRKSSCNSIIKSTSFSISFCSMLFARLCKTFFEGNNAQKYLVHTNWVESLFILFARSLLVSRSSMAH